MTIGRCVRLLSGSLVLLSLALGAPASPAFQSQNWLWFTGLFGFMLAQSAITGFCPMVLVLRKLGVKATATSVE